MHALVIDDSHAVREVLGAMLRQAGWTVTAAANGRTGLDALRRLASIPDVALVDWYMPELDGLQFIEAVRGDPGFGCMQIVMVTGEAAMDKVALALARGANEYVMKPFDREVVLTKLALLGLDHGQDSRPGGG